MSTSEPKIPADSRRAPGSEQAAPPRPSAGADSEPRESVSDALARARSHGQAALTEALASVLALLDAASLASAGELASANGILAPAARALENLLNQISDPDRQSMQLLQSVAAALDAEISRWEERARDDPDARSVLRAFLGLRELIWEFGVRTSESSAPREPTRRKNQEAKPRSQRKKIQRIPVKG